VDWNTVEETFLQASELKGDARDEYLDRACAGDPALRAEVESLLAYAPPAHTRHTGADHARPFTQAVARFSAMLEDDPPTRQRIGPYRVEKSVGHGGMGAVYLAVRDDDSFRKQVAIKVIHGGIDQPFLRYRFLHERQILANLEHPNIARLLDGGATEDGMPYLVMEYVDGEPLTTYCARRQLNLRDRLTLFLQVCGAVQHAHRNLVIHRDLKPSNILVTGEGQVKLLDFGIAKLLDHSDHPDSLAQTATALRMLTPDYASPEQVRGAPVSTASDVYSLGALHYELLSGAKAHEFKDSSPAELDRVVCQTEPRRASESARLSGDPLIAQLAKLLAGDLDNILSKSMQKEPARRYSSVDHLADDLRRYLDGLPVHARQDTLFYRSSKFVRRNRVAVLASVLVFFSLVAGLAATLWQANEARRQRERAEQRFQDVRGLATTILLDIHDQIQDLPGSTKARQFVLEAALKHLNLLSKDPTADAALRFDLASAYYRIGDVQGASGDRNLGETERAIDSLGRAAAILRDLARRHPDSPVYVRGVGMSHAKLADAMAKAGRPASEFRPYLEESHQAMLIVRKLAEKTQELFPHLYTAYNMMGDAEPDLERKAAFFRRSIEAGERWHAVRKMPVSRLNLSLGKERLALTLASLGDYEQARKILEEELAVRREIVTERARKGRMSVSYRGVMFHGHVNLARLLAEEDGPFNDRKAALALLEGARPWMEELAKEDAQDRVSVRELAKLHRDFGDVQARSSPASALAAYEQSAALFDRLARENELYRKAHATVRAKMAVPLARMRRTAEATRLAEEGLATLLTLDREKEREKETVRQGIATAHGILAELALDQRDAASAQQHARKLLDTVSRPEVDPRNFRRAAAISRAYVLLARAAASAGDATAAAQWRQKNIDLWREASLEPWATETHRLHLRKAEQLRF
jgi:serine/threonine protein kinase